MNQCFIVGRLVRSPENRQTPNGVSVTTFSVAVNRRFNREQTDYLNIVTWRTLADNCARNLVKGQQVAIRGEIQTRSYDGKDGVKRYITEIVADEVEFLAKPNGSPMDSAQPAQFGGYQPPQRVPEDDLFASDMGEIMMDDEELPF